MERCNITDYMLCGDIGGYLPTLAALSCRHA